MKHIFESDPNWFEKEEAAIDAGDEVCPVCGCCSLVEAEIVPDSIFDQIRQFQSGTPAERHMVCASGCKKGQPHR
jgi:hypothetical protein